MSYRSATNLFDEWKAAHDHLTRATQSFFDACATLSQFIDESPAGSAREKSVEDVVIAVYGHRKTFSTTEKRVQESHAILRRIINTSITLAPINALPLEVLSHIFTLLVAPSVCVGEEYSYIDDFSNYSRIHRSHPLIIIPSVCTHWRRLAIRTPSLWSHVDIGAHLRGIVEGTILPRARLWLEQAGEEMGSGLLAKVIHSQLDTFKVLWDVRGTFHVDSEPLC
ncbi:hypothetical protein FRC12_022736 [Ceratobasidium sp. 428]|nr:hypothetical protein FRC12_022736 [Ceratobasidium sp. 428]